MTDFVLLVLHVLSLGLHLMTGLLTRPWADEAEATRSEAEATESEAEASHHEAKVEDTN